MNAGLKEIIGDELHVSISQLKSWMLCPRQFELHYVRGETPEFVPKALAFGTTFHAVLATYYQRVQQEAAPPPLEALTQTFADLWRQQREGKIPLEGENDDEEEGKADPVDLGARMLKKFHEQAALPAGTSVAGVEMPFGVSLHDPDTGEVLEEKLVGVVDLVLDEPGGRTLIEHKTASKKYDLLKLRYDFQPTAYQLAMKEQGGTDVGLRYQVVTKTKSPQVQIENVTRTEADEDDFRRIALGVLKAIDAGVSYPVRSWACKSCPYKRACSKRSGR